MADEIFEQFGTPYWLAKGKGKVFLPVFTVRKSRRKNLAKHKRLFKDGERIDNMAAYSDVFTVTLAYYNGQEHPEAKGRYPDDIEAFEEAYEPNETGELFLPQYGPRQCQIESLERVEENSKRDYCAVSAVWVADHADDDQAARWAAPSASTVASKYAAEMVSSGTELGIDTDPIGEIQEFCGEIEGLASAPADYANAVDGKITQTLSAIARVEETFSNEASSARSEVYSIAADPGGTKLGRQCKRLADIVGAARNEAFAGGIITKIYPATTTIFAVAIDVKQPVEKLAPINSHIRNLLNIAPNVPVRVFAV